MTCRLSSKQRSQLAEMPRVIPSKQLCCVLGPTCKHTLTVAAEAASTRANPGQGKRVVGEMQNVLSLFMLPPKKSDLFFKLIKNRYYT